MRKKRAFIAIPEVSRFRAAAKIIKANRYDLGEFALIAIEEKIAREGLLPKRRGPGGGEAA